MSEPVRAGEAEDMRWPLHRDPTAERPAQAWHRPLLWTPIPPTAPACCCPAAPVVQAVIPPTGQRRTPVELLLCHHHYRRCHAALTAAGAVLYDPHGALLETGPVTELARWPVSEPLSR